MPFRHIYPSRTVWEKIQFWLCWVTLAVWWCILVVVGVMAADRTDPIEGLTGRFIGWSEHNPRIGIVEWTGIRVRSCDGWSYRQLINGHVNDLTPIKITRYDLKPEDAGKKESWRVEFELPRSIVHDGHYRIRPEYYCNAFHRAIWPITLTPADVPFKVPQIVTDTLTP